MVRDHALKQRIYDAADEARKLARKAAQEAARGNKEACDDLLYQATVVLDHAREGAEAVVA